VQVYITGRARGQADSPYAFLCGTGMPRKGWLAGHDRPIPRVPATSALMCGPGRWANTDRDLGTSRAVSADAFTSMTGFVATVLIFRLPAIIRACGEFSERLARAYVRTKGIEKSTEGAKHALDCEHTWAGYTPPPEPPKRSRQKASPGPGDSGVNGEPVMPRGSPIRPTASTPEDRDRWQNWNVVPLKEGMKTEIDDTFGCP
jgi:hypothetical protein